MAPTPPALDRSRAVLEVIALEHGVPWDAAGPLVADFLDELSRRLPAAT